MKKFIILLGMLLLTGNALLAQKLIIGVKAPDRRSRSGSPRGSRQRQTHTDRILLLAQPTELQQIGRDGHACEKIWRQPQRNRHRLRTQRARNQGNRSVLGLPSDWIPTTKLFPLTEQNSYRSAYCSTTRTECFGSEILRNSERKSCKTRY